ncbi:MAG: MBOAT family protein [Bacteroidales bacterium]|nr:MBOAT family protein [Bacteroidales bacterium]
MQFNSLDFAIFLPIVFLLYWFVFNRHVRWQNLFVVAASYLFYGMWDWRFLFLIAFTSLCSWGSGLLIGRYRAASPKKAKLLSALNIVVNLLILCVFKYYNFFATAFADLFLHGQSDGLLLHVILPVGISFYTFQALSYSIDVYRGKLEPVRDIVQFFAYVSFFPQLVAGPIERATNLLPQFGKQRTFSYDQAVDGLRQMLWGLFKKMAIADNCAVFVDEVFGNHTAYDGASLALAAVLFAFQIYADFSGYSDIAIGVAKLFGIKLMRNFNNPYFSRDIAEFWRRWHISLTTWFRDYVYIPLGGSRTTKAKIVRNTLIIFLVSGFWHGANWTFIAWGAFHALLFLPLILAGRNRKYTDTVAVGRWLPSWKECLQMTLTFLLVVVGWIFFRADTISMAASYLCGLLGPWHNPFNMKMLPALLYIAGMMTAEWFQRDKQHGLDLQHVTSHFVKFTIYYILIFIIFIAQKGSETFIYFQF